MMSRYLDIHTRSTVLAEPSTLPVVDWSQVGQSAPVLIPIPSRSPTDPLPKADIVILTWTENEWTAFDHVFLRSTTTQPESSQALTSKWSLYSRQAPSSSASNRLWGYFQLVRIAGAGQASFTVMLFKCDAHLAHPPWISGLAEIVGTIIAEAQPSRIYSIGTAGGANGSQRLGDVAITNAAKIQLTLSENTGVDYNNQTFTCTGWFPNTDLVPQVQADLFLPLSGIATQQELQKVLQQTQNSSSGRALASFTLSDLLNPALDPANLGSPKAVSYPGIPLLTTDTYYIAPSDTPYAALEMDDAVIAYVAGQNNIHFAFVRNISDTLIPSETPSGQEIPAAARKDWSSAIYDHFGLYTSFNGALAAWATIAGSSS
jgi:hypothetical protein